MRLAATALGAVAAAAGVSCLPSPAAWAWEAHCEVAPGVQCLDAYAEAQTPWGPHPLSEHRSLLAYTLSIAGLPADLQDDYELTVYTSGDALQAGTPPDVREYTSIRPVRTLPREVRTRVTSLPSMANLPDFSYTLWDWASGNETCPPDPFNVDAIDCHDYKTHLGWLNASHFLPMAERWYQHLHGIALARAAECAAAHEAFGDQEAARARFHDWLLACEREALAIEGVAQHYLQDAWSVGHMWERWGGARPTDFGGDRTLGFAISVFSGLIHGAKSVAEGFLSEFLPEGSDIDDPMSAPHAAITYVEPFSPDVLYGAGDVFVDNVLRDLPPLGGGAYDPQRDALLGCAVDGIREVYAATAQLHGPLAGPDVEHFDPSRRVSDDSCWAQRVTNGALATGCGLHVGTAPNAIPLVDSTVARILPFALARVELFGLPRLSPEQEAALRRDAASACADAVTFATMPGLPPTFAASGGLRALAGVKPNSHYLQGSASPPTPPASFADPFLPWNLDETDAAARGREEALALTFLDAHAADRCSELTPADLEGYVEDATQASQGSEPPEVAEARCGQCARMIAPHLRFGTEASHDPRREALCTYVNPGAAFLYTDDAPASFTGDEPTDLASLLEAAYERCGCCGTGYVLTRLGIPPGNSETGWATAINDAGVVVGNGDRRAFRWTPQPGQPSVGTFSELSPLSGDDRASADDINTDGDAVGSSVLAGSRQTAVVWHGSAPSVVGPTAQYSGAAAINDAGLVSGSTNGVGAWVVDDGAVTFIGGSVLAINQAGALAGSARPSPLYTVGPAFWTSVTALPAFIAGYGVPGLAWDLNDADLVVGSVRSPDPGRPRPFSSQGGGGWTQLPTIPGGFHAEDGDAYGVNEKGEIVGSLWTGPDVEEVLGERAVLWVDGDAVDLNTLIPPADAAQFVLAEAHDINERGQIVGWGVDLPFEPDTYHARAFLLTPRCAAE